MAAQRWALTLTSNVCCHASSVVDSRSVPPPMPALAKNRSIGPKASSACSMRCDVAGLGRDVGDDLDGAGQRVGDGGDAVEVGDDDAGAAGVEAAGEGGADAAGGSGDDDMAVVEVHHGDRTMACHGCE